MISFMNKLNTGMIQSPVQLKKQTETSKLISLVTSIVTFRRGIVSLLVFYFHHLYFSLYFFLNAVRSCAIFDASCKYRPRSVLPLDATDYTNGQTHFSVNSGEVENKKQRSRIGINHKVNTATTGIVHCQCHASKTTTVNTLHVFSILIARLHASSRFISFRFDSLNLTRTYIVHTPYATFY